MGRGVNSPSRTPYRQFKLYQRARNVTTCRQEQVKEGGGARKEAGSLWAPAGRRATSAASGFALPACLN